MPTPFTRSGRELGPALQRSMAAIQAVVIDRPDDVPYLAACAHKLQTAVSTLPRQPREYGIIHGDVIRTNALVADDGAVWVIDVARRGPG